MAFRRRKYGFGRRLAEPAVGLTVAGVTAGAGAQAIQNVGGPASANAAQGVSNFSSSFATVGTLYGFGAQLEALKVLKARAALRRRRR